MIHDAISRGEDAVHREKRDTDQRENRTARSGQRVISNKGDVSCDGLCEADELP